MRRIVRRIVRTVITAFSMWSAVPMPQIPWEDGDLRWALCAFPLIGAAIGLCWWGWASVCALLDLPDLLRGAGSCAIPILVTGGIHLDGYADTWDALASHASPERRQRILRDPHSGAFAVIHVGVYLILDLALWAALIPDGDALLRMGTASVLSRALSGQALTLLPLAEGSSMARTFAGAADRRRSGVILGAGAVLCTGILLYRGGAAGILMVLAAASSFWTYARTAEREFGGTAGDLAGWFLQRTELWMLGALVLGRSLGRCPGR